MKTDEQKQRIWHERRKRKHDDKIAMQPAKDLLKKIVKILRKNGIKKAKRHHSSMVRGWSNIVETGYEIHPCYSFVDISVGISEYTKKENSEKEENDLFNKIKDVLVKNNISFKDDVTRLIIEVKDNLQ